MTEKTMGIDWEGLEAFRATLPVVHEQLDFQHETYRFGVWLWDIVIAQYLIAKQPRQVVPVDVEEIMKAYGLPKTADVMQVSWFYIDEKRVMSEEIDTKKPIIFTRFYVQGELRMVLIDGLQRVVKAYRTGERVLYAYMLTPEEDTLCRIR